MRNWPGELDLNRVAAGWSFAAGESAKGKVSRSQSVLGYIMKNVQSI